MTEHAQSRNDGSYVTRGVNWGREFPAFLLAHMSQWLKRPLTMLRIWALTVKIIQVKDNQSVPMNLFLFVKEKGIFALERLLKLLDHIYGGKFFRCNLEGTFLKRLMFKWWLRKQSRIRHHRNSRKKEMSWSRERWSPDMCTPWGRTSNGPQW